MELWWFLEPMFCTAFVILIIGSIISEIVDKATNGHSFAAPIIAMISMIPLIICVLLMYLWLVIWLLRAIWSPFL